MRRTEVLQEVRKMRFEEAYEGWQQGRLSQSEAASLLGVHERTFRRYQVRYEGAGLHGLRTAAYRQRTRSEYILHPGPRNRPR